MISIQSNIKKIDELAKIFPNDQQFGEQLQEIAARKDPKQRNFKEKVFYSLTRGNAQELGERVRSLVNGVSKTKKFYDLISEHSDIDTSHLWLVMSTWK